MITNISLPQTEEIGLETITTAKISTSFHRSPVTFKQFFTGDPKIWNSFFNGVNRSPCHSKELLGKPVNLQIQILSVWSPPWVGLIQFMIIKVTHWEICLVESHWIKGIFLIGSHWVHDYINFSLKNIFRWVSSKRKDISHWVSLSLWVQRFLIERYVL